MPAEGVVLLLKPPGEKAWIRDCYCSTEAKRAYYPHPLDLLLQSGILAEHFDVRVVDATAENLDADQVLRRTRDIRPNVVLFLSGSRSRAEELPLLERIAAETGALMVGSGDYLRFDGERAFTSIPWLDCVMRDFVTRDLLQFLLEPQAPPPPNIVVRRPDGSLEAGPKDRGDRFGYPPPRHDLFPLQRYRLPFRGRRPFASLLSSYGCVASCTFCHATRLGAKLRDLDNLRAELHQLSRGLGMHRVFVRDATFGLDRAHASGVCDAFREIDASFVWNCWARLDSVDEVLLEEMRDAGCSLIQYGIEMGDDAMARHGKRHAAERTETLLRRCRALGIETLGHFMLALPQGDPSDDSETIRLARALPLDYASFNLFEHRLGTKLGDSVLRAQGESAMPAADPRAGWRVRRRALASFYLRPSLLARHLVSALRRPRELIDLAAGAGELLGALRAPRSHP